MSERGDKVDEAKAKIGKPAKVEIPTKKLNSTQHFALLMWATTRDGRTFAQTVGQIFAAQRSADPPPRVECPPFPPEFCSEDPAAVSRLKDMALSFCLVPNGRFDVWLRALALQYGAALK